MIARISNLNPVIDARLRWQGCLRYYVRQNEIRAEDDDKVTLNF